MSIYRFSLLVVSSALLAACTPEPQRDTTADTSPEVVDSPGAVTPTKPVTPTKTYEAPDPFARIPRERWVHGAPSDLDKVTCAAKELTSPDPAGLRQIMKRNGPQLLSCYKNALPNSPTLAGNISMRFLVRSDGSVRSCTITRSLGTPEMGRCMCQAILAMRGFRAPLGRGCHSAYTYTLKLTPPN